MNRSLAALVIGNANYDHAGILRNPVNDANDIAAKLEESGFAVEKVVDGTHKEMDSALRKFKKNLKGKEVGLFFFAGHGVQIEGDNYLAAKDTETADEIDAKHSALPLNKVIETMESAGTSTNIIILDACRDNPWDRAWRRPATSRGLAPVYAPKGTLIAFSTSPGQVAADGKGRNGTYTSALLDHIDTPDLSIEMMFKRVRNTLSALTSQKQISWEHTSLAGEFYFNLSVAARITKYSSQAISDELFILNDKWNSHRLIKALRSYNWYTQNPALKAFTAKKAEGATVDSLFVVGRNIYQAACGTAAEASSYISEFMNRTSGLKDDKRKAILDGMLFEIFFNGKGELREKFKLNFFNAVFQLQQYDELSESFDFISECLLPYSSRFYSIPGKPHSVAIEVVTGKGAENPVREIFYGGMNILLAEDDWVHDDEITHSSISKSKFEEEISEQMIVPSHLLTVTYGGKKDVKRLQFPYGYTTRKHAA